MNDRKPRRYFHRNTYFEGTVSGSSGSLDVSGDEMKGVINGIMPANVSLRRKR